jgi:parallel beta-helix repeat protein
VQNVVLGSGAVGIGLTEGSIGLVEGNVIRGARLQGIAIQKSTALKLNGNAIAGAGDAGIVIVKGSKVLEMVGNAVEGAVGPRFVKRDSHIAGP